MSDIIIEITDKNGIIIDKTIIKEKDLLDSHNNRTCSAFCSYCYQEAIESL